MLDDGTARSRIELGQRNASAALELHDAVAGEELFEIIQLVGVALQTERDHFGGDGDDLALEDVDQFDDLVAHVGRGAHRGEQQLALDAAPRVELADLDDVDQLEELLDDLLERGRVDVDHDRDPAHAVLLGGRDGEREDVVAAAGEQARHAGEHAGPVLHEHRQDVVVHRRAVWVVGGHECCLSQ